MTPSTSGLTMSAVVRAVLGAATVAFFIAGVIVDEPRLFVASAAAGGLWFGYDLLVELVFQPLERLGHHLLGGGVATGTSSNTRPTLDDTIRLLESHIAGQTSRQVDLNAAIRLEEILRTIKKDPDRAADVICVVRDRYPGAPELSRFDERGHPRTVGEVGGEGHGVV